MMKFIDVVMATQKEDDAGRAPIVLHVMGPNYGTKVYARLTIAEARKVSVALAKAIAQAKTSGA